MKLGLVFAFVVLLAICASVVESFSIISRHANSMHSPPLLQNTRLADTSDAGAGESESSTFAKNALDIASSVGSLAGEIVVVKYGGNAMTSPSLSLSFCQDVAALQNLGIKVVVVHGGGPQISNMLDRVGVECTWQGGMRVSSSEVVEVAEMVLCGTVNKKIANGICSAGGRAIGISGRDDNLLQCSKKIDKNGYDLGFVGKVDAVNTQLLTQMLSMGVTPVVAPIGTGVGDEKNIAYNVNADVAAGRIAGEIKASRVLFLTDIAGVLDKEMKLLRSLTTSDIESLIEDETITGGMIPKVSYATDAVKLGVGGAFITDGRVPHALLTQMLATGDGGQGSSQGGTIVTL
uniref:acetylglutamate kinase n=1 Tax=Helicotheca tamesis TaxID=374047 RepID=A0A7S2HH93_9STRA|mmetsp:Transcript_18111/g.24909  ORF Transcript_18111/g.24909 Transcript_18111/m.24909 type:complete len:348 (+) Transcript_18111:196-1239(+)|eukprot:CAMPEP_0185724910 /NCGR_PEP_ID=MMETSP1171-20130828/1269_1 /TAXON_ID=374046 /ORGANISM="Helicotheca tamensis, Strain CCMP826" /LENGTH=347 /DNA_ID=CAMNT_0028392877 /DNA_START=148 /DNA_END=1191 /DNA_ORIENTATION=-